MATRPSHNQRLMSQALVLARKGYGQTSPNPMVGAILTRGTRVLGEGWHEKAGQPHAEINAIRHAQSQGHSLKNSTLHVTLEPCSTQGQTPPCTLAIIQAGIKKVVVATPDPNPRHAGRGLTQLQEAGIEVVSGVLQEDATLLNEAFNHWILHQTPFVTLKSALTLDGKIATPAGESQWITSEAARARAMTLRQGADGILVGIHTVLADNPSLTVRLPQPPDSPADSPPPCQPYRIVLDAQARTPLSCKLVSKDPASRTLLVVSRSAPRAQIHALRSKVSVLTAPLRQGHLDLPWLMAHLGRQKITSLLVEGGGEVNASFLNQRLVHRVAFFYAPKIIGGHNAVKAVAGPGAANLDQAVKLHHCQWETIGPDLLLNAKLS
jgi:diaminohydroxyphosphoribosylaminopyrimidine deaminase/5-amino-6-(5-phosphoribosylamino)uracil reductase